MAKRKPRKFNDQGSGPRVVRQSPQPRGLSRSVNMGSTGPNPTGANPDKKRPAVKKPAPAPVAPPYNPLAALTPMQMQQQATQMATAQLQPQLNAVDQAQASGLAGHDTRNQQIQGWADWSQGNANSAFDSTQSALNSLIAAQGTTDQNSQNALAAALRAGSGSTDQAASLLGVASPTDLKPGLLSSADSSKSAQLATGGGAGALMGLMGANRNLPGVQLQNQQEVERQRWNAQQHDFNTQRQGLTSQIPGLIATQLKDARDFEMAKAQMGETKANNLFQQYLAEKEFNLKDKSQTFQEWLAKSELALKSSDQTFQQGLATDTLGETIRSNKAGELQTTNQFLHQRQIDWANVGINRTQAEGTLAQLEADYRKEKDGKKKEKIKLRGESIAKALEALNGYLTPQPGESRGTHGNAPFGAATPGKPAVSGETKEVPATSEYKRTFDDALRKMTQYTSRSDALRLLMKSDYPDWRKRATEYYNRMKRRPGMGASGYPIKGGSQAGQ